MSDVELTRGMALADGLRTSLSTSVGRRSSISFIDDQNVPAFEEPADMYLQPQGDDQYDFAYQQPDYMMDVEVCIYVSRLVLSCPVMRSICPNGGMHST